MPKIGSQYYCRSTCSANGHRQQYVPGRGYPVSASAYRNHRLMRHILTRDIDALPSSQVTEPRSQPQTANASDSQYQSSQNIVNMSDIDDDQYSEVGDSHALVGDESYDGIIYETDFDDLTAEDGSMLTTGLAYDDSEGCAVSEESDDGLLIDASDSGNTYGDRDGEQDKTPQSDSNYSIIAPAPPGDENNRRPADPVISADDASNIRWLNFKQMHQIDNVGFSLFSRIPGIAAKSLYFCKEIIDRCVDLRPVVYDCWPKVPCINFCGAYSKEQECPKCHEERFQILGTTKKVRKSFTYIPLRPRIHAFFGQAELASRILEYPTEVMNRCQDEPGAVMDFWNGDLTKRLREAGYFKTKTEIALTLSVDGVQLVKKGTHQVWPIMGVIMNHPPDKRYNKQNLLLFGAIPGPNTPRDIFSFLGPLLEEIKELSETGMTVWNAAQE